MSQSKALHPLAWLAWLMAVLIALTTTRNPFYIGLILLWITVVAWCVQANPALPVRPLALPFSLVNFSVLIVSTSTLFNWLTVHIGSTVVGYLPSTIPLFGGALTLEAAVYGALNGLVLVGIMAAFLLVNQLLPVRALVQLIPRAYYPVAIVVAIALSFVPVTLRQFQQVREAQAVRGHRVRGLRDWLPLMLPLLIGGLERALQLAEAMMARGFASTGDQKSSRWQSVQIGSLLILMGGWLLRLVWQKEALGLALMLVGAMGVASTLWLAGRRQPYTVYRPLAWRWADWVVAGGAALLMAGFLLPLPQAMRASLFYYPYPTLTWPPFTFTLGFVTVGLLAPALFIDDWRFWIDANRRSAERHAKIQNLKSKIEHS